MEDLQQRAEQTREAMAVLVENRRMVHMEQTETGYDEITELALNPSSCLIQTKWDFSDSDAGGRFSRQFQAYRFRRHQIPASLSDPFDNGHYIITTRNKLRGRGRSFKMRMETEAGKDCRVVGWNIAVNGNAVV